MFSSGQFYLFLITESWLTDQYTDSIITSNSNFIVYRKDRSDGVGGGALTIIDNIACTSSAVAIPEKFSKIEILCFDIFCSAMRYRIIVCYRPPRFDAAALLYISHM